MNMLKAIVIGTLACVASVGCSKKQEEVVLNPAQGEVKTRLETQMKAAAHTQEVYHAMDNPSLLTKLMEQSKAKREPFNSPAYRELQTRTNVDAKALATLVSESNDARALLPLLLLRKLDNKSYQQLPADLRAHVLTEALQGSTYFNVWGVPNFNLEDASQALIETGSSAVPELKRMLSDTRPAPVFGSQEYMEYKKHQYRVCDYALLFLTLIKDNKANFRMPVSPAERDGLIKSLAE